MRAHVLVVVLVACRAPVPETAPVAVVTPSVVDGGAPIAIPVAEDAGSPCEVHVLEVTHAEVYRGPGDWPAREAAIERLDPKTAQKWEAMDHGVTHLQCTYRIEMNGTRYTYSHLAGQSFAHEDDLQPASCRTDAAKREVEKRIREFTHGCTDPHAGAYWGYDLVP